mgnify:CR=1 FL=1
MSIPHHDLIMSSRSPRAAALRVLAAAGPMLGTYFPTIDANPARDRIPMVLLYQDQTGVTSYFEWAILATGLGVIAFSLRSDNRIGRGALSVVAGGLASFTCYLTLRNSVVGFNAAYIPTWAWYLSLLGGVLLLALGLYDLGLRTRRWAVSETSA